MSAPSIEPFFFGPEGQRLFGVYHRPTGQRKVPAGAVLCYPFLQEYLRSHRAFLRLAVLLSARGWHVLRFDYSGCGDSYGEGPREAGAWVQDLQLAARELRERTATVRFALIGLRHGASLAASAASTVQPLSELVLWDPVDGPEYLTELRAFRHAATMSPSARQKIARLGGGDLGVGLKVGPELMQAVARLGRSEQLNARAERILVLDTQKRDSTADFAHCLGEAQDNVTFKRLSERPVWVERKRDSPNNILVPALSLRAIVDWVSERDA